MSREEERMNLIERALTASGPAGFASLLERFTEPEERLALARAGLGVANAGDWPGKDLDALAEIARTGIDECLNQDAIDAANIISYNLAATLADCWPEDPLPRERRHFELGAQLAEACLRWREELKKGPFPFSIAHWVRGIHRLDLGQLQDATADMRAALEHAQCHARGQGQGEVQPAEDGDAPVEASEHFIVAISIGYLGLARHVGGDPEGEPQLEEALEAFRVMARDESLREDAEFGVGQLQYVRKRLTAAP